MKKNTNNKIEKFIVLLLRFIIKSSVKKTMYMFTKIYILWYNIYGNI